MLPGFEPQTPWLPKLLFVGAAALAALVLRLAWYEPLVGVVVLAVIAGLFAARWLARRRLRRLMRDGQVNDIIARWSGSHPRVPHAGTMGPLMTATALAAYGWIEQARSVLGTAERGPAWEAALEHRLFLDALLFTFEGEPERAISSAERLESLPLPTSAPALADRMAMLRGAAAALARAFAHRAEEGDHARLLAAGHASPLVHWAMRYGAAIIDVDRGELARARGLIDGAPDWPAESCFGSFHRELTGELERRTALPTEP